MSFDVWIYIIPYFEQSSCSSGQSQTFPTRPKDFEHETGLFGVCSSFNYLPCLFGRGGDLGGIISAVCTINTELISHYTFFEGQGGTLQRKSQRMIPKTVWLLCLRCVYFHVVNCYCEPSSTDNPVVALVDQRALCFLQAKQALCQSRHYDFREPPSSFEIIYENDNQGQEVMKRLTNKLFACEKLRVLRFQVLRSEWEH